MSAPSPYSQSPRAAADLAPNPAAPNSEPGVLSLADFSAELDQTAGGVGIGVSNWQAANPAPFGSPLRTPGPAQPPPPGSESAFSDGFAAGLAAAMTGATASPTPADAASDASWQQAQVQAGHYEVLPAQVDRPQADDAEVDALMAMMGL